MSDLHFEKIWEKVLNPNEKVRHEFSMGFGYRIFWFVICCLIVLFFIFMLSPKVYITLFLLIIFYFLFYLKIANVYAFTDNRIIIHRGWLSTHTTIVDYDKITDISIKEPIIDKLFTKTGSIYVNTAGTSFHEIILRHITRPYELKKKLEELKSR